MTSPYKFNSLHLVLDITWSSKSAVQDTWALQDRYALPDQPYQSDLGYFGPRAELLTK